MVKFLKLTATDGHPEEFLSAWINVELVTRFWITRTDENGINGTVTLQVGSVCPIELTKDSSRKFLEFIDTYGSGLRDER